MCVHTASEDLQSFERLPHPHLSEPLASVPPGPAPQGHQQFLVNDNPDVYAALGRGDREQGGEPEEGHLASSSQSLASSPHRATCSRLEWFSHFLAM